MLLKTKLTVPPVRSSHIRRAELLQKLDKIGEYKLALIVAPAGYGKTALVSEWIAQHSVGVGWFSIDAGDNDPVRFWDYVIAAIQTVTLIQGSKRSRSCTTPSRYPSKRSYRH